MGPKPGVGGGAGTVPEFDAVGPYDDLASEVSFRRKEGKVLERVGIPDPAVIGNRISERIS
jgi:hypothetical protein